MAHSLNQLPADLAQHRVLDTTEAAAFCKFSVRHWRRLYQSGQAPAPFRQGGRKYGWQVRDLIGWIDTRRNETGARHAA